MKLTIEPRVTKSKERFLKENPPFSVALDGYVEGPYFIEHDGPYVNFNHHEGVNRLTTRSTSGQVMMLIKMRIFDLLKKDGKPFCEIFINDPDQDTCLASWLLMNHERLNGMKSEPLINRLLTLEDVIDTTGGAFPLDVESRIARAMGWIFEPYTTSRISGRLTQMQESEMRNVIECVHSRIDKHILGGGGESSLDTRYKRIGGGDGWAMIVEDGYYARTKLFSEGISAFVSVRERGNKTYDYSIGRMSEVVDFPLNMLYNWINSYEGVAQDSVDRWGGSDIIGGSPRSAGSKLTPQELEGIINSFLISYKEKRDYIRQSYS